VPGTTGNLSYQARVAANVLAIVERELAQDPGAGGTSAGIGGTEPSWDDLARAVRAKLAVANPRHLAR
jgi:hypothetical protein